MESASPATATGHTYGSVTVHGTAHLGDRYDVNLPSHIGLIDHRHRLIESLRFPEMNARLNAISETHHQTFEWLFTDEERNLKWDSFTTWLENGNDMYLIEGKAGSGKSTLMKFIYHHENTRSLLSQSSSTPAVLACHCFWLAGSDLQKNYKGLIASLTCQLLEAIPLSIIEATLCTQGLKNKFTLNDWSALELEKLLFAILPQISSQVFFLIDGLDEFDSADRAKRLMDFLMRLKAVPTTRVCVSSRPTAWIEQQLSHAQRLRLQDLTEIDIARYARETVTQEHAFHGLNLSTPDLESVVDIIIKKADGVFLWVTYALHSLAEGFGGFDDLEALKRRLVKLPSGMQELYDICGDAIRTATSNIDSKRPCSWAAWASEKLSLFDLTVMMDETTRQHYQTSTEPLAVLDLEREYRKMERKLWVRTAGLLQCIDRPILNCSYSGLTRRKILPFVTYLHRTVHDFLYETEYGRSIMAPVHACAVDLQQRKLLAELARIVQAPRNSTLDDSICYLALRITEIEDLKLGPLPLYSLGHIETTLTKLLHVAYPTANPPWSAMTRGFKHLTQDFPSLLVSYGGFANARLVMEQMTFDPQYFGLILCHAFMQYNTAYKRYDYHFGKFSLFIAWLIESGADLHTKQILWDVQLGSIIFGDSADEHCYKSWRVSPIDLALSRFLPFYYPQRYKQHSDTWNSVISRLLSTLSEQDIVCVPVSNVMSPTPFTKTFSVTGEIPCGISFIFSIFAYKLLENVRAQLLRLISPALKITMLLVWGVDCVSTNDGKCTGRSIRPHSSDKHSIATYALSRPLPEYGYEHLLVEADRSFWAEISEGCEEISLVDVLSEAGLLGPAMSFKNGQINDLDI